MPYRKNRRRFWPSGRKLHVILIILGFLVFKAVTLAALYFSFFKANIAMDEFTPLPPSEPAVLGTSK